MLFKNKNDYFGVKCFVYFVLLLFRFIILSDFFNIISRCKEEVFMLFGIVRVMNEKIYLFRFFLRMLV